MHNLPANDPTTRLLAQAQRRPDAIAVIDGPRQISYRHFAAQACGLTAAIRRCKAGARVLIDAPQGVEAYVSLFAALMAGSIYSVLNRQWPAARQRLVIDRFQPDIVLTVDPGKWHGSAAAVIDLSQVQPFDPGTPSLHWNDMAYVLFTSGSTGIPKGVEIGREGLIHYLDWVDSAIAYAPGDQAAQHPNLSFDLSVVDTFGALCGGATLIPATSLAARSMPARFIRDHGITVWNSVPGIIDLMLAAGQCDAEHLGSLRLVNACGEPFYARQARHLRRAVPQAVIQNTYGPTEATVSCTALIVTDDILSGPEAVLPLGKPIEGMHVMLEEGSQEILIAGPQVAKGYLNDAAATTKAFGTITIDGLMLPLYRTGDLGEVSDGHLYFRGRRDRQVKVGGYRVELAEVEATIGRITEAPCHALIHSGRIAVFVQARALPETEAIIQRQAALDLPAYAVPQVIRATDSLPRNHNDKIDVAALERLLDSEATQ